MANSYQLITFDVYTALFDIETSLAPVVRDALGDSVDVSGLVRTWRSKQLEYALISNSLDQARISFRIITGRSLDYALGRAGVKIDEPGRASLVAAWDRLQPWPEADAVVSAVKAGGYQIGMLSNGDQDMLSALQNRLSVNFDYIFSTEQAGHYKPHPSVYILPAKALGIGAGQMLHVAGSPTDVHGTKSAGLPCYWSNRATELVLDPACAPDYEFEDLKSVLDILMN